MKTLMNLLFLSTGFLAAVSGCLAEENLTVPEIQSISDEQAADILIRGNNEFALDLYTEICDMPEAGNIFFSPYSISSALGMTYSGARGQTALDMAEALHFTLPANGINRAFHSITETLNSGSLHGAESGEPFTLAISNGLWVQNGFKLLDEFVAEVTRYYSASVENLDFSNDAEGSREIINDWVAESTMDKILNLIPSGVLGADTRVVLTNAVYFKASWRHPFNEHATSDSRFILTDGSAVSVPTMTQTEHFNYASTEGCSAVELGYTGGNSSMLIILPDGDMQEFQHNFNADMLETIRGGLSSRNVHLSMPRFEFTKSIGLSDILSSLGMESAFGSYADFSGFTGNRDLYISEVLHKAFVKVDEEGTEAAAATAVVMNLLCMPETPLEMTINRPFVFIILDRTTGSIIFIGRVMDPSA
ncbi:MAG: serpin family protein [Candidatus Sabulitectum sp.]|nr:serpin family protein [Candidatus Sabulitectum sp.]